MGTVARCPYAGSDDVTSQNPITTRDHTVKVILVFRRAPGRGVGNALSRVTGMLPWVLLRLAAYRLGAEVTVETLAY